MKLDLEIHTPDRHLSQKLMEAKRLGNIASHTIDKDVTIEYEGTTLFEATDDVVIVSFTLRLAGAGAAASAGEWLAAHLRDQIVQRLVINRTTVPVDAAALEQVINAKLAEERPLARDLA